VSGRHQATTVQDIQEFSFKGYDQQPPGFSKPGFLFFGQACLEINPAQKTSNDGPSDSGPVDRFVFGQACPEINRPGLPTFCLALPTFFSFFTGEWPPLRQEMLSRSLVYDIN